jgi:hypothetical protein
MIYQIEINILVKTVSYCEEHLRRDLFYNLGKFLQRELLPFSEDLFDETHDLLLGLDPVQEEFSIIIKIRFSILSTSLTCKFALSGNTAYDCLLNWHVRENESYVFLLDQTILVKVIPK